MGSLLSAYRRAGEWRSMWVCVHGVVAHCRQSKRCRAVAVCMTPTQAGIRCPATDIAQLSRYAVALSTHCGAHRRSIAPWPWGPLAGAPEVFAMRARIATAMDKVSA